MDDKHEQILLDHIVATLPGDINQRRALLNAAVNVLHGETATTKLVRLLSGIDSHLAALRELPLANEKGGQ